MIAPSGPPPVRLTRRQFLDAWMRDNAAVSPVRIGDAGASIRGRDYIALPCNSPAPDNPGWAMVHNDPDAIRYFNKLFGRVALPSAPAPPR